MPGKTDRGTGTYAYPGGAWGIDVVLGTAVGAAIICCDGEAPGYMYPVLGWECPTGIMYDCGGAK